MLRIISFLHSLLVTITIAQATNDLQEHSSHLTSRLPLIINTYTHEKIPVELKNCPPESSMVKIQRITSVFPIIQNYLDHKKKVLLSLDFDNTLCWSRDRFFQHYRHVKDKTYLDDIDQNVIQAYKNLKNIVRYSDNKSFLTLLKESSPEGLLHPELPRFINKLLKKGAAIFITTTRLSHKDVREFTIKQMKLAGLNLHQFQNSSFFSFAQKQLPLILQSPSDAFQHLPYFDSRSNVLYTSALEKGPILNQFFSGNDRPSFDFFFHVDDKKKQIYSVFKNLKDRFPTIAIHLNHRFQTTSELNNYLNKRLRNLLLNDYPKNTKIDWTDEKSIIKAFKNSLPVFEEKYY